MTREIFGFYYLLLLLCYAHAANQLQDWKNGYDQRLFVDCPPEYAIYRMKSEHDNNREDRRYIFECSRVSQSLENCYWTGWINEYDQFLKVTCNRNEFMAGVESIHSNYHEDRRWRIKCCSSLEVIALHCSSTGYLNTYDETFEYKSKAADSEFFNGLESYHNNGPEDRRWKVSYCQYGISRRQTKQCINGYVISGIYSDFYNHKYNDRTYRFECEKVANYFSNCYWTDFLNEPDGTLYAQCKSEHIINGIDSYYIDGIKDRRFRLHCCYSANIKMTNCQKSKLINKDFHGVIKYPVPRNNILHRLESNHSNGYEDRKWIFEVCKFEYLHKSNQKPENDDYTFWCKAIQQRDIQRVSETANLIKMYLEEDEVSIPFSYKDCDGDMYFTRECAYYRAATISKKLKSDLNKITKSAVTDILYKMWELHPWLRELCQKYDSQYYKQYLKQLSTFDSEHFAANILNVLSFKNTEEIRKEVAKVCSSQPQDLFCTLDLVFYFVDLYVMLPHNKWNETVEGYKEAIIFSFLILKTNYPKTFVDYPPKPDSYINTLLNVSDGILTHMFYNNMHGLTKYASFLPPIEFNKCVELANFNVLNTFMKVITQIRVFSQTYGKSTSSSSKFVQWNTNYKEFLLQNRLDEILKTVTRQQQSSTTIANHVTNSIKETIKNFTIELKNHVSKVASNNAADIKKYFQKVHSFERSLANTDIRLIVTNVDSLNRTLNRLQSEVESDVYKLLNYTFTALQLELLNDQSKLHITIITSILKPTPVEYLDRLDDFMNTLVGIKKASGMVRAVSDIKAVNKNLTDSFNNNTNFLESAKKIVDQLRINGGSNLKKPIFAEVKEQFLKAYADYIPTLGTSDIVEVGEYWESLVSEACYILNEEATGSLSSIYKLAIDSGLCRKTAVKIAKLIEVYIEVYEFQFELIDALASYMRSSTALEAADSINTQFAKLSYVDPDSPKTLDTLNAVTRLILITYKMHTFQIVELYCNFLEYKNGGEKPDVCQGFNTDISLLISLVEPTCNDRFHEFFYNVPTRPSFSKDTAFINLTNLYKGIPTPFKIPNKEWLVNASWITNKEKNYTIYVENFEVYLPVHNESVHRVSVVAKTIGGNVLNPGGTRYTIYPNQPLEFKYLKGPILSCRQQMFNDPYRLCENPTLPDKICPSSITEKKNRLYPSIYSEWLIAINGFENHPIPIPATDLFLAVGLKLCTFDSSHNDVQRKRRHFPRREKSVSTCCETGQYWDRNRNKCLNCPNGTRSALDGYYCQ